MKMHLNGKSHEGRMLECPAQNKTEIGSNLRWAAACRCPRPPPLVSLRLDIGRLGQLLIAQLVRTDQPRQVGAAARIGLHAGVGKA